MWDIFKIDGGMWDEKKKIPGYKQNYGLSTLVPETIYKERGAMERGRGAKRGRGKIASGRIRWKSHFHAKPKYRN